MADLPDDPHEFIKAWKKEPTLSEMQYFAKKLEDVENRLKGLILSCSDTEAFDPPTWTQDARGMYATVRVLRIAVAKLSAPDHSP